MKIATIVGARPQFVKAAMVSKVLRARPGVREVLVHTGQHYNPAMSTVFFEEMEIPPPDHHLGVGSSTHGRQTGEMLAAVESTLLSPCEPGLGEGLVAALAGFRGRDAQPYGDGAAATRIADILTRP